MLDRRKFLQQLGLACSTSIISIGSHAWVARSANPNRKRCIVILCRGAMDGLNMVIPYREQDYYNYRPSIGIAPPGQPQGALDLDGRFGLHPALAPILPLWQNRSLAFIHASGSSNTTKSHFDAQRYMETGTPGNNQTSSGWMNRLLSVLSDVGPTQAVHFGSTVTQILGGSAPVASLSLPYSAKSKFVVDFPQQNEIFDRLYAGDDPLSLAYRQGRAARTQLLIDLDREMKQANKTAPSTGVFEANAPTVAQIMIQDPYTQLAFLEFGNWDTHVQQGGFQGNHAQQLKFLAEGLNALVKELKGIYSQTTIVVMSEFGRSVRENGNRGTDHGYGNVMFVLGGGVKGGKIHGTWPTLATSQLHEGRDLAVTSDFRDVISNIISSHLQIPGDKLATILPEYTPTGKINLF
jgi:uncharacterized protein (DUF1501 family)